MPDNPFASMTTAGTPGGSPFGGPAPTSTAPGSPGPTNGAAYNAQAEAPQQMIDPNDPRLFSEQEIDPKGDAFGVAPLPPDDRKYKAKLKLIGVDDNDPQRYQGKNYALRATKKDGLPYFATGIALVLLDPSGKYDGVTLYPEFGGEVGTLVTSKMTASKVSTIIGKLGAGPDGKPFFPPGKLNQLAWMEYFVNKVLPTEPTVGIEIRWEGSCPTCSTEASEARSKGYNVPYPPRVTGMMSFPPERDPEKLKQGLRYSPNLQCKTHGQYRGRATVVNYLNLVEVR